MTIGFAKLPITTPQFAGLNKFLEGSWIPHYNTGAYEGDWQVFTLRSPGGTTDNILAESIDGAAYADTPHMELFPSVKKLVNSLQCEVMSVRLLNLKAGAVIKQHRDKELSFEQGEARLHFPIVTNHQVEFFVNDRRVIMLPGQCWYINANMPHRVANYGNTDRIHLVIDCVVNNWLTSIFEAADRTEFNEPPHHDRTLQVIQALREQNTPTTNSMADRLEAEINALTNIG